MSIRSIIEGLDKKKQVKEEDEAGYTVVGSNLSKEDAERLAKEKGGTVVADEDSDDKYSVIKKEEVR